MKTTHMFGGFNARCFWNEDALNCDDVFIACSKSQFEFSLALRAGYARSRMCDFVVVSVVNYWMILFLIGSIWWVFSTSRHILSHPLSLIEYCRSSLKLHVTWFVNVLLILFSICISFFCHRFYGGKSELFSSIHRLLKLRVDEAPSVRLDRFLIVQ